MVNLAKSSGKKIVYRVEELKGDSVQELERHWRQARAAGRIIQISLSSLDNIDDAGKTLLTNMFSSGAELLVGEFQGKSGETEKGWLEIPALE